MPLDASKALHSIALQRQICNRPTTNRSDTNPKQIRAFFFLSPLTRFIYIKYFILLFEFVPYQTHTHTCLVSHVLQHRIFSFSVSVSVSCSTFALPMFSSTYSIQFNESIPNCKQMPLHRIHRKHIITLTLAPNYLTKTYPTC